MLTEFVVQQITRLVEVIQKLCILGQVKSFVVFLPTLTNSQAAALTRMNC